MICSRIAALGFCVAVALCLHPQPAGAQSNAAKAQAKAALGEGGTLYEGGDYAGALQKFRRAYQLFPSPKIHFNFGLAYRGLARHVDALEAFEKFIAETPDADPARKAEAQDYINDLRAKIATVEVTSDRDGAEVSIDGRSHGTTPLDAPIRVNPGAHQVVVKSARAAAPYIETIEPLPGSVIRINVRFTLPVAPAPTLASSAPAPRALDLSAAPPPAAEVSAPLYTRWWVWAGTAAIAAGVVAAVMIAGRDNAAPAGCGPGVNFCAPLPRQ